MNSILKHLDASYRPQENQLELPRFKSVCCQKYTVDEQMRAERSEADPPQAEERRTPRVKFARANYHLRRVRSFSEQCKRCPFRQITDEAERDRALHECFDRGRGTYRWKNVVIEFNNQYR